MAKFRRLSDAVRAARYLSDLGDTEIVPVGGWYLLQITLWGAD